MRTLKTLRAMLERGMALAIGASLVHEAWARQAQMQLDVLDRPLSTESENLLKVLTESPEPLSLRTLSSSLGVTAKRAMISIQALFEKGLIGFTSSYDGDVLFTSRK